MKPEATAPPAPSSGMVRCPRCGAFVPRFYLDPRGCQDCSWPRHRRLDDDASTSTGSTVAAIVRPAVIVRSQPNPRPAHQRPGRRIRHLKSAPRPEVENTPCH